MNAKTRLMTGLVTAGLLASTATIAAAADVTLRYSNWLPVNYFFNVEVMQPWFADIERVTEGRVVVETTPKVVGTVPGQYDVIADGLADIGFILPGYTPGRFPVVDGLELPFLGDDASKRCPAVWEALQDYIMPTGAFDDVQVMGILCTNAGQIAMADTVVTSVEDLKGKKIRTPAPPVTRALELLEAVPVSKPASEIYELASGGVIDGAIIPLDSMVDFKLDGPLKKVNTVPGGMVSTVILIPMNQSAWSRISEEDQQAILEVSGATLADRAGAALSKAVEASVGTLEDAGVEIIEPEADVIARLQEVMQPVREEWIAAAGEAGMEDPEAMLEFIEERTGAGAMN